MVAKHDSLERPQRRSREETHLLGRETFVVWLVMYTADVDGHKTFDPRDLQSLRDLRAERV